MTEDFDAIVLGAGEAGAIVASRAVAVGLKVALAYRDPWGSTCVNVGCVPSKFMIHRARIAHLARTSRKYHIELSDPKVDLGGIVREKNESVEHHREESFGNAKNAENLTLLKGAARFVGRKEVEVVGRRLRSDKIFIATGMRPSIPPMEGLDEVDYLTNESLMQLTRLPPELIVVGGGYVGCELGQTFARYGSKVTLVQGPDRLLPEEEEDASLVLAEALEEEGIRVITGKRAKRVTRDGDRLELGIANKEGGAHETIKGTHLLLATGRRPNSDGLNLEAAGVKADKKGNVIVDEYLETNVEGIYAIGDVNGQQPFTRVCQEEGKVAFANACGKERMKMHREFLPHAIFTDPAIGAVGLTEAKAREQGLDVEAGLVHFSRVEKAEIVGETTGFMKLVVERSSRTILGCTVIGPDAENLVYDAVIVMRHQGTVDEIAKAVGVFPTLQEGMEGTARAMLRKLAPDEVSGPLVSRPIER